VLRRVVLLSVLALAGSAPAASATVGGTNGDVVASFTLGHHAAGPSGGLVDLPTVGGVPASLAVSPPLAPGTSAFALEQPAWAPDASRLAFTVVSTQGDPATATPRSDVDVSQPDGSGAATLVADAAEPSFSPDGSQVAVHMLGSAPGSFRGIALVDVADGNVHPLVGGDLSDPVWAPFGDAIAYIAHPDPSSPDGQLWTVGPDGTGAIQLAGNAAGRADWAPDDTTLAYAFDPPGPQRSAIGTVDAFADPGVQVSPPGAEATDPAWSPDGTLIAYAASGLQESWGDGADPHTATRLFVVPAAGGAPVLLNPHFGGEPGPEPVYGAPAWQPVVAAYDTTFDDSNDTTDDTSDTTQSPSRRTRVVVRARAGRFGVLRLRKGLLRVPCRISGDLHARCGVKASYRKRVIGTGRSRRPGAHQVVLVRLNAYGRRVFAHNRRARIALIFTPIVATASR
jgi:hypothetical protein